MGRRRLTLLGALSTPLGEVHVKGRDEPVEVLLLLRSLPLD